MSAAAELSEPPVVDGDARPVILCVDDEAQVLKALGLHLRRRYEVLSATSGIDGLRALKGNSRVAVVLSDMRMPGMDGAAFLQASRTLAPDATRMLLTGQADMASAIAAINQGRIFRFLTKPCAPDDLLAAVADAVQQHALVTGERVLLEQTLHGSIKTLTDLLALTHPAAFGRAVRVKGLVADMARQLAVQPRWPVEVAAMLLPLGMVSLPAETAEKIYYGLPLSGGEADALARCPAVTEQLLGNIPRLELVRETLAAYWNPQHRCSVALSADERAVAERCAAVLRAAVDFDTHEAQGDTAAVALAAMRSQAGRYPDAVLEALVALRGLAGAERQIRELPLAALKIGMVFADDVKHSSGALLVPRGMTVTAGLIERLRTLPVGVVKGPLRVIAGQI